MIEAKQGLKTVLKNIIDPSPEEMFIRRLMQDARLASNWKMVDKDNDGFLSYVSYSITKKILSIEKIIWYSLN